MIDVAAPMPAYFAAAMFNPAARSSNPRVDRKRKTLTSAAVMSAMMMLMLSLKPSIGRIPGNSTNWLNSFETGWM